MKTPDFTQTAPASFGAAHGCIAPVQITQRVTPGTLRGGRSPLHLDLFSGIGGFSLAAESVGFQTIAFSEIEPYACQVLNERWPNVPNLGDVRNVTRDSNLAPDLVTGGFPCQPFSLAGKRGGDADERYLWPECVRVLRELRPRFALFENVTGLLHVDGGRTFNRVLSDLAAVGYDVLWNCIPACAVGAPIERDRVWIVAVANEGGGAAGMGNLEHGEGSLLPWPDTESEDVWIQAARAACGVDDGIPEGAYKGRVGCIGNSIVPQVVTPLLRALASSWAAGVALKPLPTEKQYNDQAQRGDEAKPQ